MCDGPCNQKKPCKQCSWSSSSSWSSKKSCSSSESSCQSSLPIPKHHPKKPCSEDYSQDLGPQRRVELVIDQQLKERCHTKYIPCTRLVKKVKVITVPERYFKKVVTCDVIGKDCVKAKHFAGKQPY